MFKDEIKRFFIDMAKWAYLKVEENKIYLKTNILEHETDKNTALLGENIFKLQPQGLLPLANDTEFSDLINKIVDGEAKIRQMHGKDS
jgi:hypothetical protein